MNFLPALTVFDVETTGLSARGGDKIIEIAGLRVENGIIDETKTFVSLVNPERQIPWEARQVNTIKDEDVRIAPTIDKVLPEFLEFAAGSMLVAHNATFDLSFLQSEKEFCWGFIDLPECFCTMKLSQATFPHDHYHNLNAVSGRLQLAMPKNRHRALPDVILTAQALLLMIEKGGIRSLEELRKKAGVGLLAKK